MKRLLVILALLAWLVTFGAHSAKAQTHNNISPRTLQYEPGAGGDFFCVNGNNRYTRALYGSHTDWRLETSDRPVFAVVKKGYHRNIRFVIEIDGKSYPLEEVRSCTAPLPSL